MKIYIIEDDVTAREELGKSLSAYGYECDYDDDFENIVSLALEKNPDLILLDLTLPYYDGNHICREIRKASSVPIIILTSRNTEIDEIMSLKTGADDYMTKPFNIHVLLARIEVLMRKNSSNEEGYTYNGLQVFPNKCCATYGKKTIDLTKNELQILLILINHGGEIIKREDFLDQIWQSGDFIDDNTLTVNINRLRGKLGELNLIDFIKTKRGVGYFL